MTRIPMARISMARIARTAIAAAAIFGSLALAQDKRPVSALAWLPGGVWTADASQMGNGMRRIETRYAWSDNGSYIRFTTHFITDKAELKTYDGNFFWNPSKNTLYMWYMDAMNEITEGPVTMKGDLMETLFRGEDFEGKAADLRVQVTRKNKDLYHWALSEKVKDGWKDLAGLDYARS
jgi:hypothetical protein